MTMEGARERLDPKFHPHWSKQRFAAAAAAASSVAPHVRARSAALSVPAGGLRRIPPGEPKELLVAQQQLQCVVFQR